MARPKPVDIDAAIARLDAAIEKYGTPADVELIRGVVSGPSVPSWTPPLNVEIDVKALDDPDVDQLFRTYIARYTETSGKIPSPDILNLLKCAAENFSMEQWMKSFDSL